MLKLHCIIFKILMIVSESKCSYGTKSVLIVMILCIKLMVSTIFAHMYFICKCVYFDVY